MVARNLHSSRSHGSRACAPIIESLETRRLLSGDLAGAFAGRIPTVLLQGSSQQVAIKITNHGAGPTTGPVTVSLYASADAELDGGDVLLGRLARNVKLKPGRSATFKLRTDANAPLASGSYELLAKVEDGAQDGTVKAGGNIFAAPAPVQVQEKTVDLSAQIIEIPLQPIGAGGGDPQRAVVVVRNLGNTAAKGKIAVSWFLSADTTLDPQDTMIAAPPPVLLNLGAGKARSFATDVALPAGVPVGSYNVLAQVNVGGGLVDSNPSNNLAVGSSPVMVVNVVQQRNERGRVVERRYEEIVTTVVGSTIIDDGGTIFIGYEDQGDGFDPYDPSSGYIPPDDMQPPPDTEPPVDIGPPMPVDPAPEPAPDPAPAPDGGGDFSTTGADF